MKLNKMYFNKKVFEIFYGVKIIIANNKISYILIKKIIYIFNIFKTLKAFIPKIR